MATLRSVGRAVRPRRRGVTGGAAHSQRVVLALLRAHPVRTQAHRTYQTIQGLAGRLGLPIQSPVPEGQEPALAEAILASGGQVVLICWEHQHIPALAQAIPTLEATTIPAAWPGRRFDVIWTFGLDPATGRYVFGQVPQQLLEGDTDTVI